MKKTLLSILIASVASAAFAASPFVANFTWNSQPVTTGLSQATVGISVPQFNDTLAGVPAGSVLVGVSINLNGYAVSGQSIARNEGTQTSTLTLTLTGTHEVSINGLTIDTTLVAPTASASVAAGATTTLGPVTAPLSGSRSVGATPSSAAPPSPAASWTGAGTIPVLIGLLPGSGAGVFSSPAVQVNNNPTVLSAGVGTVSYYYETRQLVPEAETYVAGLAMAGLVGYGFYRRSRKA